MLFIMRQIDGQRDDYDTKPVRSNLDSKIETHMGSALHIHHASKLQSAHLYQQPTQLPAKLVRQWEEKRRSEHRVDVCSATLVRWHSLHLCSQNCTSVIQLKTPMNGTFVGEFVVEIWLIVSNSSCIGSLAPEDANRSNSGDTPA